MSRSDRDQRDAERAARRARRLAERAEQRAFRRVEQARQAAERADKLSEQAKTYRRSERSFEDYVDEVTQKWEQKAGDWIDRSTSGLFREDDDRDNSVHDSARSAEQAAIKAREGASRAERQAAEAAAKARRSARVRDRARRQAGYAGARRTRTGSLRSRLNSGRGLYRDKRHKKVCGVCAGVADYLAIDTWKVRLVAVLGLIFVPSVAVPVYFISYFLMDDKPYYRQVTDRFDDVYEDVDVDVDETEVEMTQQRDRGDMRPRPSASNADTFRRAKQKFSALEDRLRLMESHVTSSRFELQRELRKIAGEDA